MLHTGRRDDGPVAETGTDQWLVMSGDGGQLPSYRHLDDELASRADNIPPTYLLFSSVVHTTAVLVRRLA